MTEAEQTRRESAQYEFQEVKRGQACADFVVYFK